MYYLPSIRRPQIAKSSLSIPSFIILSIESFISLPNFTRSSLLLSFAACFGGLISTISKCCFDDVFVFTTKSVFFPCNELVFHVTIQKRKQSGCKGGCNQVSQTMMGGVSN